eukprot:jgi/Ulvmu1/12093/UM084_0016.1
MTDIARCLHVAFADAETALVATAKRVDDRGINLKLAQRVAAPGELCKPRSSSTQISLARALILGRQQHARGPLYPRVITELRGAGYTAGLLANDHLKAYVMGYLAWPRDRVSPHELQQLLAGTCQTFKLGDCEDVVSGMDSSGFLSRDGALHVKDLERLFRLSEHPTTSSLRQLSEAMATSPQGINLKQGAQDATTKVKAPPARPTHRVAAASGADSVRHARECQATTAIVKLLSWIREQGSLELAESSRAQHQERARVRLTLDPRGLISVPLGHALHTAACSHPGTPSSPFTPEASGASEVAAAQSAEGQCGARGPEGEPWLQVALELDVPRPSPAAAFAALDEGCTGTCTALECQLAMHAAGMHVELREVLLLASRYRVPAAAHPWAARLLWPALLRDLGLVPGAVLPAGHAAASPARVHELLQTPPQAHLSPVQWRQLEAQLCAWERSARAALEATCGHYTREEQLLPYLKLRPRGVHPARSTQRACVAVPAGAADRTHTTAVASGALPGSAPASAEPAADADAGVAGGDCAAAEGSTGPAAPRAPAGPHVALRIEGSVKVFLVAQEAVGRLGGRVWLKLDPGSPPPSGTSRPAARSTAGTPHRGKSTLPAQPHPVFDLPALHAWASAQQLGLHRCLRLFRALDTALTATCSIEDFRYVVMTALGKGVLSRGEQHVLCAAFRAAPLRDAAARASGTHERVAYLAFLHAATPTLALLHAQAAAVAVRPADATCACRLMCRVAAHVFPGVAQLKRALLTGAVQRWDGPVLPAAAFAERMSASFGAPGSEPHPLGAVAELARVCHSTGCSGVAVGDVITLAAIVLERRAEALLHTR